MKKQFTGLLRTGVLIALFALFLGVQQTMAQQTVTGTVTDETDSGIPGANVLIEGTTTGVVTDLDGKFSISASPEDVLLISYIGYQTQKIPVGSQTSINVKLGTDTEFLDEVVVIGYGTAKKSDLTGAVSQVTTESFERQPITRVEEALQGRAAGVSVSSSGAPGSGAKVRIRGANSITGGNDPLIVVDGVIGVDLRTINPNDIASMEVLKDASALAIYGSRASNGVLLVSTKKGSGKPKLILDQFTTFSVVPNKVPLLSSGEFAQQKNEERLNAGSVPPFSDEEIAALNANPIDYQDIIFQTGVSNNTQLSLSGGDDKVKYFLSGNFVDQEGIIITTGYERFSLRSNVNAQLNEKLKLGLNLFGSRETNTNNLDNFNRFKGSSILRTLTWDPTLPVRDENGEYILTSASFANNGFNPIANLERSNREREADRLNANINIGYEIAEGLNYNMIVGLSTLNQNTESYIVNGDQSSNVGSNHTNLSYSNFKNTSHQVSNILNWKKTFDKHSIDLTGVYEFQGNRSTINNYFTTDVILPGFFLGDNADPGRESFFNDGGVSSIQSYLGRAQYNFESKLYLTASMRIDESSKFKKGSRTGYFPSAAVAYTMDDMAFVKDGKVLSSLKLRAGWGQVGNENINPTAGLARTNDGRVFSIDGANQLPGSVLSQVANPDLTWETTTQTNVGVDFGVLSNRLTLSVDYYVKNTTDLLLATQLPRTNINKFLNVGEVQNQGIDLSLSAAVIDKEDFTWDANFNMSFIQNEVLELFDEQEQILGNTISVDGTGNRLNVIQVGEPLGQFYGLTFLGTWKSDEDLPNGISPGDAKYEGFVDENNIYTNTLSAIGNGTPTLTWGFNQNLTYKNWDFNIFIQAGHNFDVYNQVAGAINGGTGDYRDNLSPITGEEWTPENETETPRRNAANLLNSSRYVEKGDFARLSNVSVGYTFDNPIKGIENLKLYASGQNLALITGYSGYDPEVTSSPTGGNSDVASGINIGAFPNPRTYTVGLKVGF